MTYNEEEQTVVLEFSEAVTSSSGPIHIEFSGILNNQMRGFYRSKYNHPDAPETDRYAAVTQFEVILKKKLSITICYRLLMHVVHFHVGMNQHTKLPLM